MQACKQRLVSFSNCISSPSLMHTLVHFKDPRPHAHAQPCPFVVTCPLVQTRQQVCTLDTHTCKHTHVRTHMQAHTQHTHTDTKPTPAPQIANRIKAKGLQKLRWYCQLCQKQCRDENGFKCHQMSESHRRQMEVFGQNAGRVIGGYTEEFETTFMEHMRRA